MKKNKQYLFVDILKPADLKLDLTELDEVKYIL